MCVFSIRYFAQIRKARGDSQATLVKHLLYATALAALFSAMILLFRGDMSRLRRCQFVISAVLLAVGMEGMRAARPNIERSRWFRIFFAIAFASMLLTPIYTPQTVAKGYAVAMSADTRAVIRFIDAIPDHQDECIFFYPVNVRVIAPYVSFRVLSADYAPLARRDRAASDKVMRAYRQITGIKGDWKDAMGRFGIRYMVFSKKLVGQSTASEFQEQLAMLKFYRALGETVLENDTWVILRFGKTSAPRIPAGALQASERSIFKRKAFPSWRRTHRRTSDSCGRNGEGLLPPQSRTGAYSQRLHEALA